MNKKDLSIIRKHFKLESERLNIGEIYNICCKSNKTVLYSKKESFFMLDEDIQEMYLKLFKKIITGTIDSKIFELGFNNNDTYDYKKHLSNLLNNELESSDVNKLVDNILKEYKYDTDILISLINCKLVIPIKNKSTDETDKENSYIYDFTICCVSKIQLNNPNLTLDIKEKEIKLDTDFSSLAIKSPIEGFIYPVLSDGYVNFDKVLYNTSKSNHLNQSFLNNVIGCNDKLTSKEEKQIFNEALASALGSTIKTETLYNIYENLLNINADEENPTSETISLNDLDKVLKKEGLDKTENIRTTLKNSSIGETEFNFKVDNIIPKKSNSIKITNNDIDISLASKDLNKIKQINNKGKKCLIIELNDDISIDGFKVISETL